MTIGKLAGPRWVLIIDPNHRTADTAAGRLHRAGLDTGVREIHAASTALTDVKAQTYAAIIVEPGIAADAAGYIRNLLTLAAGQPKLIAWTRIDRDDWPALLAAGAEQVVAKDDIDGLIAEVRKVLGR